VPEVTEKKNTDKTRFASLDFEAESYVPEVIFCTVPAAFTCVDTTVRGCINYVDCAHTAKAIQQTYFMLLF